MPSDENQKKTAHQRYESLKKDRQPFLDRARQASELTIPSVIPPEGSDGQSLPTPFQSVGARGVNNLSAKLLLALFPPQGSFFRLTIDEKMIDQLQAQAPDDAGPEDIRAEVDKALQGMEMAVESRVERSNARTVLSTAFKHLLVSGNYLLQSTEGGDLKGHPLTNFVVKRDLEDNVIEVVVLEELAPLSAPEEVREAVQGPGEDDTERKDDSEDETIKVYTRMSRKTGGGWEVHQEVKDGTEIEGSDGEYPDEKPALIPVRWTPVDNADYGRGLAMENLGDLQSLESLSQSIIEHASAASKIVFLVDQSGTTRAVDLQDAKSGDFVPGDAEEVDVLQLDKFADFKVAQTTKAEIRNRLEEAFLLNGSVQRDAERVTAQEIRLMADELEKALGGVYTALADELQRPLVSRWMHQMEKDGDLPDLPEDGTIEPEIVTGASGLGRQTELRKLDRLVAGIGEVFGPEAVQQYLKIGPYIQRRAAKLGIDSEGLVRSEEEVKRMRQKARQAEMRKQMGPEMLKSGTKLAEKTAETASESPESSQ